MVKKEKCPPTNASITITCLITDVSLYENGGDRPHTQFSIQSLAMDGHCNTFPLNIEYFIDEHDKAHDLANLIKSGTIMNVCGSFSIVEGSISLLDPSYEILTGDQYDLRCGFADYHQHLD